MSTQSQPAKQAQQLTPFASALAGALGACFSNAVVYPLDVAKTRIQVTSSAARGKRKDELNMLSMLLEIFKQEGINGWYRGFAATMLNTFSMQYAYFFFYSFIRSSYIKRITLKLPPGSRPPALSTAAELSLGAAAGALSQIFTIPVSVIATRQQVGRSVRESSQSSQGEGQTDESFIAVAREIVREDGVTGLWLGIKPGMVLTVNPAITYGVYERLKSLLLLASSVNGKLTPGTSFLLGAFSKTLATIVTYPYIMAKVRIQARTSDADASESEGLPGGLNGNIKPKAKHAGALGLLLRVLRKEGFVGWYQGMSAQIIKAVLSQALLFVSKEQFEHWALAIMVLFAKFTSRS
ncbi:mitochondrial carrier domain-containing protein [Suillus clintonianus]|uniref:mitochondrial carrier domain-containing protein n=1 Tax=Suillus clintonianus TaxID=1904413 RepID=UPI001B85F6BB|nr:mitochondrial carrier domain-containing protein [Suillus clintonianus]KAG2140157.1 mitochondrial carrier domain-containing protein [Suillus clintonianus]